MGGGRRGRGVVMGGGGRESDGWGGGEGEV